MSAKEFELDFGSDRGWWKQVFVLFLAGNCHDLGLSDHFANRKRLLCASCSSRAWELEDESDAGQGRL